MGRVALDYDSIRNRFTFPVVVEASGGRKTATMVLDTGSNRTALSAGVVRELGVLIDHLELRDIGGVTAVDRRPHLPGVTLWISGGDLARVDLPEVVVLTAVRRKAKGGRGGLPAKPMARMVAPSLFGMDALRALRGRAIVDPHNGEGRIEW